MKIKTKLIFNMIIGAVAIWSIVITSVFGLTFIKNKLSYLTQKSTPYQIRTVEFQKEMQGAITDLDAKRIVHDAKTAEGGSGAPLFGQAGKVIGVNFGVFTENTAANMAVPVRFAVDLLRKAGWKTPEELQKEAELQPQIAANQTNTNTAKK